MQKKNTLNNWLSWQEKLHLSEIDLGLTRIGKVAKKLKLLSPSFPIITIAGTNGKGSSVAFFEAILNAQGYKTGSYTSPHLLEYNERIKLNCINASDAQIIEAFEEIDQARGDISLTYFEFGTLAAMLIFSKEKMDVAIIEVGLGGRLDAANLWDTSLAIISSIGIDHIDWLGDNREKIAIEKSGIMRSNTSVVCGDIDPPNAISSEAKRIGARLYQINKDFSFKTKDKKHWIWKNNNTQLTLPHPSLAGSFQLNNAATVIAGLLVIDKLLPISPPAIKKGIVNASVPGRLQTIKTTPQWLVDVAHNPDAATQLAKYFYAHPSKGKTRALFSILGDKDIEHIISIMDKHIDEWHIIGLEGSRGLSVSKLEKIITGLNTKGSIISHDNFSDACQLLKNITNIEDRVVAFGSFLVVSEVLKTCN